MDDREILAVVLVFIYFVFFIKILIARRAAHEETRKFFCERLVDAGDEKVVLPAHARGVAARAADRDVELCKPEDAPMVRLLDMDVADLLVGDGDFLDADQSAAQVKAVIVDVNES